MVVVDIAFESHCVDLSHNRKTVLVHTLNYCTELFLSSRESTTQLTARVEHSERVHLWKGEISTVEKVGWHCLRHSDTQHDKRDRGQDEDRQGKSNLPAHLYGVLPARSRIIHGFKLAGYSSLW